MKKKALYLLVVCLFQFAGAYAQEKGENITAKLFDSRPCDREPGTTQTDFDKARCSEVGRYLGNSSPTDLAYFDVEWSSDYRVRGLEDLDKSNPEVWNLLKERAGRVGRMIELKMAREKLLPGASKRDERLYEAYVREFEKLDREQMDLLRAAKRASSHKE